MSAQASGHVALVRRKRGAHWYARGRVDGRTWQRKIGPAWTLDGRPPAGYYTKRTATEWLAEYLVGLRRGAVPSSPRSGVTFADAAEEWIRYVEHDRRRRRSTVRDYRRALDAHLLPTFGSRPLATITADELDAYRGRVLASGRSPRTVNKLLVMLNGIFRRAMRVYGLAANPCALVDKQPSRASGDFRVLDPGGVQLLAQAAGTEWAGCLYTVAAYTGLRLGELRALRWRDVDFAKRLVHVRRNYVDGEESTPKSGRVRSVPLIDQAAAALNDLSRRPYHTEPGDLVFPSPTGHYFDDSRMRREFKDGLTRAGLPRMTFHELRHTFGTLAVQAWPLSTVQAYMGHSDISTTMIYVHHVPQHDAADRLTRLVQAAAEPAPSLAALA